MIDWMLSLQPKAARLYLLFSETTRTPMTRRFALCHQTGVFRSPIFVLKGLSGMGWRSGMGDGVLQRFPRRERGGEGHAAPRVPGLVWLFLTPTDVL